MQVLGWLLGSLLISLGLNSSAALAQAPANNTCAGAIELETAPETHVVSLASATDNFGYCYGAFGGPPCYYDLVDVYYFIDLLPGDQLVVYDETPNSGCGWTIVIADACDYEDASILKEDTGYCLIHYTNAGSASQRLYVIVEGTAEREIFTRVNSGVVSAASNTWGTLKWQK